MDDQIHVIFDVAEVRFALKQPDVVEILPLPKLSVPPYCPTIVAGLFVLSGQLIAVLRGDRLLDLEGPADRLYSHLLRLRTGSPPSALLVDRVRGLVSVRPEDVHPIENSETFRGCVVGQISDGDEPVLILALERLLAEREMRRLEAFATAEETLSATFLVDA